MREKRQKRRATENYHFLDSTDEGGNEKWKRQEEEGRNDDHVGPSSCKIGSLWNLLTHSNLEAHPCAVVGMMVVGRNHHHNSRRSSLCLNSHLNNRLDSRLDSHLRNYHCSDDYSCRTVADNRRSRPSAAADRMNVLCCSVRHDRPSFVLCGLRSFLEVALCG